MAHDVFISYTTRDKAIADAVCHALEERHIRCWIAPRDIPFGFSWKAAIVGAIRDAQVMVLIFSGGVNSSEDVRREVDIAFEERRPIIPFRIEDVAPADDLFYCIAQRHWLDALTPPVEQHIGRLVSALRRFIAEPEPEREPIPPVPAPVASAPEPEPEPLQVIVAPTDSFLETLADDLPGDVPDVRTETSDEEPEVRDRSAPLMGAMTPVRIAIAAAGIVAVIALGLWGGGSSVATEPPKTGIDFYDAGQFAEAVPLLTKEADAGSVDAQARLAEAYLDGRGVAKDITLGLSFLTRAANGGNAAAQSRLGLLYEQGTGVARDLREAMRWHASAADKGVVASQCAAALLAVNAEGGVARDHAAAAKWYGAAAKSNAACGQVGYGYLHYQGYGVPKNYDEAIRLWEAAEAQGDATAKGNILNVQAGWEVRPLIQGPWNPVIGKERREEIDRLKATSMASAFRGAIFQRMRRMPVNFYDGGSIVEVEIAPGGQQPGVLTYVRLPNQIVLVNGKPDQLSELNGSAPVRLDTQPRALQAMRFLISAIEGDQGPFRVLDDVRTFEVSGSQGDGWTGKGVVQIGANAYEAEFKLGSDGALNILNGRPLALPTPPPAAEPFDDRGLRRRVRGE